MKDDAHVLEPADLALLRRASRTARGMSVWTHGDAYERTGRLEARGFLRARPHEWGKEWLRCQITEAGEAAIQAAEQT